MTSQELAIEIQNTIPEAARAREAVVGFANRCGCVPAVTNEIDLVLEEWLVNVVSYGFQSGTPGRIIISARADAERFVIEVRDEGVPFNPLNLPAPDPDTPLESRKLGGFGIHMIKNTVNSFTYVREEGWNVVEFIKLKNSPKLRARY
jgi:serine/threonine-protein kinase RsbW